MAKLCRVTFLALCVASLFAGTAAWAGEGSAVEAPAIGTEVPNFIPAPELKACRLRCLGSYSSGSPTNPSDWGMGSTCPVAEAALSTALNNRAESSCYAMNHDLGACNVGHHVTTPCYFNGTTNQTDGYVTFGCWVEVCIEPIDPY
jgi:hypothetical protein